MGDQPTLGQKLAAEATGTFVLVLFGVGAALMSGGDYAVTGLAFGLAVLVMVAAFGRVSGGHFNPAISLGAALAGRLSWRDSALYWLVQVIGGVAGGLVLWVVMQGFPGFESDGNFGQNLFGNESSLGFAWWAALLLELLMTAIFVLVVLAATDGRQPHPALAPVTIGLTLTAIHFASIGATGTSVNPARSIGANLFAGSDAIVQLWLFLVAPMLGGAVAGLVYPAVFGRDTEPVPGSGIRISRPVPAAAAWDPQGQAWPAQQWPGQPGQGQPGPWTAQPWPDPGPPREWGEPAPPDAGVPWRPPPGTATGPGPSEPGAADAWPAQDQGFPPSPTEPYWSQQLPQDWSDQPDEGDGNTHIRPTDGR